MPHRRQRVRLGLVLGVLATLPFVAVACSSELSVTSASDDAGQDAAASIDAAIDSRGNDVDSSTDALSDGASAFDGATADASHDGATDAGIDVSVPPPTCVSLGLTCVPAPPAGWSFVSLYSGDDTVEPPACAPGTTAYSGHSGLVGEVATCPACSVGGPLAAGTCGASYTVYDEACVRFPHAPTAISGCTSFSAIDTILVMPGHAVGASCPTPTKDVAGAMPVVPPIKWASKAVTCELAAAGSCDPASVCAYPPAPGFGANACIFQAGDVACPAGYEDATALEVATADTRSCSCGASFSGTCDVKRFSTATCDGASTSASGCLSNNGFSFSGYFGFAGGATPENPACAVTNDVTGAVQTSIARTVCCPP